MKKKEKKLEIKYFKKEKKEYQQSLDPQNMDQAQDIFQFIKNTLAEINQSPFSEEDIIKQIKAFFTQEKKKIRGILKEMKEKKKKKSSKKKDKNEEEEDQIQQVRDVKIEQQKRVGTARKINQSDSDEQERRKKAKKIKNDKKIGAMKRRLQSSDESSEEEKSKAKSSKKQEEENYVKKKKLQFKENKKPQQQNIDDESDDQEDTGKLKKKQNNKNAKLKIHDFPQDDKKKFDNQQPKQKKQIKSAKKKPQIDSEEDEDDIIVIRKNNKKQLNTQDSDSDIDFKINKRKDMAKKVIDKSRLESPHPPAPSKKQPSANGKKQEKIPDHKVKLGCNHVVLKDDLQKLIKRRTKNLVAVCDIDNLGKKANSNQPQNLGELCFKCPECFYLLNTKDMTNIFGQEQYKKYADQASVRMMKSYNEDGNVVKQGAAPEKCLLCDSKSKDIRANHDDHYFCPHCWDGASKYYKRSLGCLSQNCRFFSEKYAVAEGPNPYAQQFKKKPEVHKDIQIDDNDDVDKIPRKQGKQKNYKVESSDDDDIPIQKVSNSCNYNVEQKPQQKAKMLKCENCSNQYKLWKFNSCEETCKISQCKQCVAKFFKKNEDIRDCISCYESIAQSEFDKFLSQNGLD